MRHCFHIRAKICMLYGGGVIFRRFATEISIIYQKNLIARTNSKGHFLPPLRLPLVGQFQKAGGESQICLTPPVLAPLAASHTFLSDKEQNSF